MKDKILLTGFEPFNGEEINPSWELVKTLNNKILSDFEIISEQIPTVFNKSAKVLKQYIDKYQPKIIICFGQAGGSQGVRLERVAINLDDASISDNDGNQPVDKTILENGPNAYFTKLPVRQISQELNNVSIPNFLSLSAGSYVCNHLFFHLMNEIKSTETIGGFIHIPFLDKQVVNKKNTFSLDLETLQKALNIILETIIKVVKE